MRRSSTFQQAGPLLISVARRHCRASQRIQRPLAWQDLENCAGSSCSPLNIVKELLRRANGRPKPKQAIAGRRVISAAPIAANDYLWSALDSEATELRQPVAERQEVLECR